MKKILITLILVLGVVFTARAQDKTLIEVSEDLYSYTENTIEDSTHQTGFFKNVDGELLREGEWKLYIYGELKSKAVYEDDKIKSLIVDEIEYSAEDLHIIRLGQRDVDVSLN